jgi:hypothetical protein
LVLVEFVLEAVVPVALFFTFFLWVFLVVVAVSEFCGAFFVAAGAAIRNGTATTVKREDANNFFIFSPLVSGGLACPAAHIYTVPQAANYCHHVGESKCIPYLRDSRAPFLMKESSS